MSVLQEFKAMMQPGTVITVENHFLIRAGATHHARYGTTARTVTKVNTSSWYDADSPWPNKWPKAGQVAHIIDRDGVGFQVFGAPDDPHKLFLTIRPVKS